MRKILSIALLAVTFLTVALGRPALADGAATFNNVCAACHMGGNNIVDPTKTLKKEVLEQNGMYSADAIIKQATNGKGAMPAFGGQLSAEQIADVAAYVLAQADKGW